MSKKILITSVIIILLITLLSVNVFAVSITSATVMAVPSKNEYESGETVEFIISLKDLNASSGILGLGAYLDYDSNLLTLNTNAVGLSNWSDAEISTRTNRFATTKNSHSANNEDILKITFTAKNVSADTQTSIGLKKIEISNGSEYVIDEIRSSSINIKPKSSNPQNPPVDNPTTPDEPANPPSTSDNQIDTGNTDNPNEPSNPNIPENQNNTNIPGNTDNNTNQAGADITNNNNTNNSNNNNNSSSNNNLQDNKPDSIIPQLGVNNVLPIMIAIISIIAVILFINLKMVSRKIKKTEKNLFDEDYKIK